MTKKVMYLFKVNGLWACDDQSARTKELFGTSVLPTPYSDTYPALAVLGRIQGLNPDALVVLADADYQAERLTASPAFESFQKAGA
jgi:hypothetical protein